MATGNTGCKGGNEGNFRELRVGSGREELTVNINRTDRFGVSNIIENLG
jgi:hypothetical protein